MKTRLAINGVCGRMGRRLIHLALEDKEFVVVAVLEAADHADQGRDVGEIVGAPMNGLTLKSELPLSVQVDVLIDFSTPAGTMTVLNPCTERRIPMIIATTGHTAEQRQQIEAAAHETAVLYAPNMSLAVNLLVKLVHDTALALRDKDFDVEIVERHHRFKKDSPSGTALQFASVISEAMGISQIRHGRQGLVGERSANEIGIHAIRVGDNVGEHTIIFSTLGETLELTHRGHSRDCYARGALLAAKHMASRPPGRYSMNDVLGI
jgi:4-hydroxy-tetrahydrodipicolinate reductase